MRDKNPNAVALGNVTGALTLNASTGTVFTMTLTGNVTLTIENLTPGESIEVMMTQDATGSRTVTYAGLVPFSTQTQQAQPATAANMRTAFEFFNAGGGNLIVSGRVSDEEIFTTLRTNNILGISDTLTVTTGPLSSGINGELGNVRWNVGQLRSPGFTNGSAHTWNLYAPGQPLNGALLEDKQIQGAGDADGVLYIRQAFACGWRVQLTGATVPGQGFEMSTQANNLFIDFIAQNTGGGFRVFGGGQVQFQVLSNGSVMLGGAATTQGFFGSAGAVKQVGVPVTAAGIHAALVAYGLIAA